MGFEPEAGTGGGPGVTPPLEDVLGAGNSTGNQMIVSPDGNRSLNVSDSSGFLRYSDGLTQSVLSVLSDGANVAYTDLSTGLNTNIKAEDTRAIISYDNPLGATGSVVIDENSNTLSHSEKIILDAPLYNFASLTASTVPVLDASKNMVSSSVTPTELGSLSGVTSQIQTQLDSKNYWKIVAGSPTRVGNTSFTITDTANANLYDLKYGRTTVLKWTDTAVTKMAMVVNTVYAANSVTVTIIGDILAASATMTTMSYSHEKCKPIPLVIAGTLATGTDLTGRYNVPCMMKIFGADGYHTTAGTTNATTYDINLNGTTFMTTKLSIASGATSGLGFTADSGTVTGSPNSGPQSISVDCDSVSTTAPVDAYIHIFMIPLNNQYL